MKHHFPVSICAALILSLAALPTLAALPPGTVDQTFNSGTPVIIDMNSSQVSNDAYTAAMNPLTHDILWTGSYQNSTTRGGTIVAYTTTGLSDTAVGTNGTITLTADQVGSTFTGGDLGLDAIAVDGQGRILVAGTVGNSAATSNAMVLARFKPDGSLDTTFNSNGSVPGVVTDALNTYAFGTGLSLTADGHIFVTGTANNAAKTMMQLTVWRFNPDGTADTSFNGNGHVQIATVNDSWPLACFPVLQPDGALIAGCQQLGTGSWKLTRLTANGAVDTGFGNSGFITGAANQKLTGLALAPDGGFVISEVDTSQSPNPLDMRRYLVDGKPDNNFGSSGLLSGLGNVPSGVPQVPVAVQPDGKILISGNGGGNGLVIVRFLANGTVDSSFGSSGSSNINFNNIGSYSYTPTPTALLLQGDGSIVASGWATSSAGTYDATFVTRVLNDSYTLTPTTPVFKAVTRVPLGQAVASNAVTVKGVSIGSNNTSVNIALTTRNGKYGSGTSGPFAGSFTSPNISWVTAGSTLALEQKTPTTGGKSTKTSVVLGGFWAANNYEVPLGSPARASWITTTDQPPVASNGTLSATTAKTATGTLSATNPSNGTLTFAIVIGPSHGKASITNATTGAYSYTSNSGYTNSDSFTWKVNDGVTDSNIASVNVTVKAAASSGGGKTPAPSSGGGGGGSLSPLSLLALALLGFLRPMFRRCRGLI